MVSNVDYFQKNFHNQLIDFVWITFTNFSPMFYFFTHCKRQKIFGIETKH